MLNPSTLLVVVSVAHMTTDQFYTAEWRDRSVTPPPGRIWVTDGEEIWMLEADGEPFPERATACKFWTPAVLPMLPNGKAAAKIED